MGIMRRASFVSPTVSPSIYFFPSSIKRESNQLARSPSQLCSLSFPVVFLTLLFQCLLILPTHAQGDQRADKHMATALAAFQDGKFEQAALNFSNAAHFYEEENDLGNQIRAITYLAEAVYSVGQYQKALAALDLALRLCGGDGNCPQHAIILGRIGNVLFAIGETDSAIQTMESALASARESENAGLSASLLNDLGNLLASENRNTEAIAAYTECIILSEGEGNEALAITALTNSARAWVQEHDIGEAKERLNLARARSEALPDSHHKATTLVNIGIVFQELAVQDSPSRKEVINKAGSSLTLAAQIGERIGDQRIASYAWGRLGNLYESEGQFEEALQLTRRAILTAQQMYVPESLYQWEWQTGRLLATLQRPQEAIEAYQRAMQTLQPIRSEFFLHPTQSQLSFRQKVGPLFFQLADLLLRESDTTSSPARSRDLLLHARETIEAFKVAELQDYFRDDCVQATLSHIETIDKVSQKTTAILYPIILPDRLEMLISIAGQLHRQTVPVDQQTFIQEVRTFRRFLEKRTTNQYKPHAQQLYDWLIKPIHPRLQHAGIDTLVFVPDGALRTIPIGALHDGQRFLTQHYALATTPGLTLTDPQPLNRDALKVLSVGLTESVQGFPPLPNVGEELNTLDALFHGKRLLNEQFVVSSLEREMKEEAFTIVHIASHGKFANNPKDSFLLAFDQRLTMDRLDDLIGLYQFRESPLDLLTLSACETAAGDDRAALGLAGVAIKAGARSALATLWFINDKVSSDLVAEFYTQLQNSSHSKASALQHAQVKILKNPAYQHPGYWSPFLLLNNWL